MLLISLLIIIIVKFGKPARPSADAVRRLSRIGDDIRNGVRLWPWIAAACAVASQFQSELIRKLVFYRDKLKLETEQNHYRNMNAEVTGVCMTAYSIARNGNVDEIEQAIPLVVEIFAYLANDGSKQASDIELLTEASEFLNDALSELEMASADSSISEVAGK